jgi:dihydroceramide fatty acyl 2-hydroxylase
MRRSDVLKASPPMFESPFLDRFTRVHPAVPVVLFAPVIAWLAVLGAGRNGWVAVPLVAAGYVAWTLTEYWLHRVVFHYEPEDGIGARLHWMIHGVHHDHPNDPMRLVMPPSASIPLAAGFYLLFWAALGADATQKSR